MSKILQFLREVQVEFKNITWPKKDALIKLTIVIISFSIVISLILGGFDYLFTQSFGIISNLKNTPVLPDNSGAQTISITVLPSDSTPTAETTTTPAITSTVKITSTPSQIIPSPAIKK